MKIQPQALGNFFKTISPDIKVILLYGPDRGLILERIGLIKKSFLGKNYDVQDITQIFESTLKDSPEKLREEAYTTSLFGGEKRFIILRDIKDSVTKIIQEYIKYPADNCLVVIEGDDFSPSSSLRKLCEKEDSVASIACYLDSLASLRQYITQQFKDENFRVDALAIDYLLGNLGNDRGITKQEIDKLILYRYYDKSISLSDVEAVIAGSEAIFLDKLIFNFFNFKKEESYKYLMLLIEDMHAISIIRTLINHLNKISYTKNLVKGGMSIEMAMKELRPPIFFAHVESFKQQVRLWDDTKIDNFLTILLDAEIKTKTQSNACDIILRDIILQYSTRD